LENDAIGRNIIFAGSDSIEKADSLTRVDGDLGTGSFQRMQAFKGWKTAENLMSERDGGRRLRNQCTYCKEGR
jgi:hypothetical protein